MTNDYDAIVIGGGLGGAIALRELQSRGFRSVLLEARDRVGGRAWTPLVRGERTDLGGQNIYWTEPYIWTEITRYQLAVTPTPAYEVYAIREGEAISRYTAAEGFKDMVSGLTTFNGEYPSAFPQPYQPTLLKDRVRTFDHLSVRDRLEQVKLSSGQLRWLEPYFAMISGGELESMSFAWMAYLAAWAGGVPELLRARSAYRVVEGLQTLVALIVEDSGADIRLDSPVASVLDDGHRVVVTTSSGEELTGSTAVLATSGNTLSGIDFPSGLAGPKLETSRAGAQTPNAFHKLFALVEGDVESLYVQRPDFRSHGLIHARRDLKRRDGLTQVIGFSVDPALDDKDSAGIVKLFSQTLDIPSERIADVVAYNWVEDPWSRGGTAFLRPGQFGRLDELAAPEGRLTFAVSDFRYGGYNSAVEEGLRASAQARRILADGPARRPLER